MFQRVGVKCPLQVQASLEQIRLVVRSHRTGFVIPYLIAVLGPIDPVDAPPQREHQTVRKAKLHRLGLVEAVAPAKAKTNLKADRLDALPL